MRLPAKGERIIKEDWVVVRDSDRVFAQLNEASFVLSKDEKGTTVFKTFQLDCAAVTKGKKNGNAAFVVADPNGKALVTLHNAGAAQEWVSAIKTAIVVACAERYEPETVAQLRPK